MCPLCVPAAKNAATCHQQPALSSGHTTKHRHVPRFSAIDAMDTASPDRMDELTCAICLNLLCEPVLWPAADAANACRHVFCRNCIVRCVFSPSGKSCPLCRAPASSVCVEDLPVQVDVQRQVMECRSTPYQSASRRSTLRGKRRWPRRRLTCIRCCCTRWTATRGTSGRGRAPTSGSGSAARTRPCSRNARTE